MRFEFDNRSRIFQRHGGKKNRRNVVLLINRIANFSGVTHIDQIGKNHINRFYVAHSHLSDRTLRNYYYAMRHLYQMLGRSGLPPMPKYNKELK